MALATLMADHREVDRHPGALTTLTLALVCPRIRVAGR
jgi:hypothetical protein